MPNGATNVAEESSRRIDIDIVYQETHQGCLLAVLLMLRNYFGLHRFDATFEPTESAMRAFLRERCGLDAQLIEPTPPMQLSSWLLQPLHLSIQWLCRADLETLVATEICDGRPMVHFDGGDDSADMHAQLIHGYELAEGGRIEPMLIDPAPSATAPGDHRRTLPRKDRYLVGFLLE